MRLRTRYSDRLIRLTGLSDSDQWWDELTQTLIDFIEDLDSDLEGLRSEVEMLRSRAIDSR